MSVRSPVLFVLGLVALVAAFALATTQVNTRMSSGTGQLSYDLDCGTVLGPNATYSGALTGVYFGPALLEGFDSACRSARSPRLLLSLGALAGGVLALVLALSRSKADEGSGSVSATRLANQPARPEAVARPAKLIRARIPPEGLVVRTAPNPNERSSVRLPGAVPVAVLERLGDWARIRTEEGMTGWVDARRLVYRQVRSTLPGSARRMNQHPLARLGAVVLLLGAIVVLWLGTRSVSFETTLDWRSAGEEQYFSRPATVFCGTPFKRDLGALPGGMPYEEHDRLDSECSRLINPARERLLVILVLGATTGGGMVWVGGGFTQKREAAPGAGG